MVVLPNWGTSAVLEFVLEEGDEARADVDGKRSGFGLTQVWGAGESVQSPSGKSVKERAEAWFDRLD